MEVLRKAKVESALGKLAELGDVYVPMQRGPVTGFFSWKTFDEDYDDLMLDILNVYQPPKNIVLPQKGKKIQLAKKDAVPRLKIIFAVRSCDIQGIDYLDDLFLTNAYENNEYKADREKTVLIANACYHPGHSCFCTSMGVNPTDAASADVIIHDVGKDGYVWESKTEKGQQVTAQIHDLLEEKELELPELLSFSRNVDDTDIAEKLGKIFDHPLWEKYSEPCISCGLCTYACPTCTCSEQHLKYCKDEDYDFPCYDSCLYRSDTLACSEIDPRQAAKGRLRNRFYHKLRFFSERYGKTLCTGCGRCIVVCPAGYGIDKMITEIREAE